MTSSQTAISFGRLLRRYRRGLDLTLREVAESVGCSLSYLSKLESGQALPKQKEMLGKLGDALNLDCHERATFKAAALCATGSLQIPPGVGERRCSIAYAIVSAPKISEETLSTIERLLSMEDEACP
ncbi:helix-turn-helix domain-containing protein [Pseudoduganella sp. R-31]|uniref:helix-turn-helix domain-containing protein n=1 Tax=Pseudoduganella sp. R-31 TaxID=3404060 RepID=UPI003CF4EC34